MDQSSTTSSDVASGNIMELANKRRQFKPQQSTVSSRRQQAVCVRRAFKQYGSKSNANVILDGLNMTVPKGTIYGLLGASGCGKTTLLNCIVGRKRLNSGEIWVLGGKPGSRGSGVPGPRIGYMPQEIALYGEFSIRETLLYFGWVCGMTTEEVDSKLDFLVQFLMLPSANRLVKNLSGGQQRRVSFAAALVHDPELLILDEPTVGVDPLLRQNIWDHLVKITKGGNRTVIITTHYIEETRQAHMIGLMRGGYFLAEESPDRLMQIYGTETLEDVFLKLSVIQNLGKRRRSSILIDVTNSIPVPSGAVNEAAVVDDEIGEISGEFGDNISISGRGAGRRVSLTPGDEIDISPPELPPEEHVPTKCCERLRVVQGNHMRALLWKNFLWMWRNVPVMLFIIGLPVSQIVLFALSIGHDPRGLPIAIKNYELNTTINGCPIIPGCNNTILSCRYLKYLEKKTMVLTYHDTEDGAIDQVRRGRAWLAMIFPENYTDSFKARMMDGKDAYDWDIDYSEITVYEDKSNQQISVLLYRDLNYALQDTVLEYLEGCNINPLIGSLPLRFNQPIYGDRVPNFTDFAAPGVILTVIFFLAVALTSGAMLLERNEGILERSLVSGITGLELLLSHMTTQFTVMAGQTVFSLVFSFGVFGITNHGNYGWILLLTLLTGVCGMCFGFVVSCVCETERTATYMAMGSFLPIVMLCGIIWPVEGMHLLLRQVSLFLPLTKSTESLRSILQRGWGIKVTSVWAGFVSTFLWIAVFLTLSILLLKFKKG